jgi:hypothetical protein
VNQLRFEAGLGVYTVNVAPESVWVSKGVGTHCLTLQLDVGSPAAGPETGRLLCLETILYAPELNGPRMPLAHVNISVAFNPESEFRRPRLQFLLTNPQLRALEDRRNGDLRLELEVSAFLPHAVSGFPGAPLVTEHISIAESRWRQQLAGLGRTLGAEMLIPFPDDDEPRQEIAGRLREAQRLLAGNETDSALLQVRKALEVIRKASTWGWAPGKDKKERTPDERWALIRSAMEDQASGAVHEDAGTRNYQYSRTEVEALIAATAALATVMN